MLLIYRYSLSLSLKLFSNANYLHICMKHQRRHSIISKMYFSLKICIRTLEENNHLSLRGVWGTSMEDATQAWIRVTSYDEQFSDNLCTNPSTERTCDRKRLAMLKSQSNITHFINKTLNTRSRASAILFKYRIIRYSILCTYLLFTESLVEKLKMLTKSSVLLCQINKPLIKVQSKYIFISCISVNITHFKYSQENEIKRSMTTFEDSFIIFLGGLFSSRLTIPLTLSRELLEYLEIVWFRH